MSNAVITNSSWNKMSARVSYQVTQDIGANTSRVTVTGLELNSNSYYGNCYVTGSVYINGQEVCYLGLSNTEGHAVALAVNSWNSVNGVSGTPVTLPHDAEGNRSITVSVSLSASPTSGSGSFTASCAGAVSVSLPTIPRVTDITAAGAALGEEITITLSRAASGFTDTVSWHCGGQSGVIAEKTGETTLVWTPPVSLAAQNTTGDAVAVTLTAATYSGDTALGEKSVTLSCPIPDSVVPTLSVTVTDKTGCFDTYGSFVRSRSQARVQTAAAGAYGSTVTGILVSFGSLSASGEDVSFSLTDPGAVPITVKVTDSRGRTASASRTITVADYQNPAAVITALYRCDADGNPDPQGAYGKAVFTGAVTALGGKNAALYRLKKRIRGADSWAEMDISAYAGQYTPQGETVFPAGVDSDWEICVTASDSFTAVESVYLVLPVAFALLDFDRESKSAGILQRAATPGAVDIGGDTVHHGHRLRDVGAPEEPDDAVTKEYVDGAIGALDAGSIGARPDTWMPSLPETGLLLREYTSSIFIRHGAAAELWHEIGVEGYTPFAIVEIGTSGPYSTFFLHHKASITGTTAYMEFRNLYGASDGDVTVGVSFKVLYYKA